MANQFTKEAVIVQNSIVVDRRAFDGASPFKKGDLILHNFTHFKIMNVEVETDMREKVVLHFVTIAPVNEDTIPVYILERSGMRKVKS